MTDRVRLLWSEAQRFDPDVSVADGQIAQLMRRELRPTSFSRDKLFSAMIEGRPLLANDLKVPVSQEMKQGTEAATLRALRNGFPHMDRVTVRCGPRHTMRKLGMEDLLAKWASGRGQVHVTDLHVRGTNVTRMIDCANLSDFNLLPRAGWTVSRQEMLTMVVSSRGSTSDSHTDDPDGSNHCFIGRKLWLAWDTFEGLKRGLEDAQRCDLKGRRATFSMNAFLSTPGAQWWVVEPGKTLFLPGHLTHRVVTLDSYVGIGSFYVMLPNYVRTLSRWTQHRPLWTMEADCPDKDVLVDKITHLVIRTVVRLSKATRAEQDRWGLARLVEQAIEWHAIASPRERKLLLANPLNRQLLNLLISDEIVQAGTKRRPRRVDRAA